MRVIRSMCRRCARHELCEVVSRPAELLSARFETDSLAADIARRTAEESPRMPVRCRFCPICSTTCGPQWSNAATAAAPADGSDRPRRGADRARRYVPRRPSEFRGPASAHLYAEACHCARGRRADAAARARSEFSDEEWRLVSELADHPNRLLVTATPEAARPTRRSRTRRSSAAGTSFAIGSPPSASS